MSCTVMSRIYVYVYMLIYINKCVIRDRTVRGYKSNEIEVIITLIT